MLGRKAADELIERVHLLNHILRMIVEPNAKQHPDITKLNLNVTNLEEVTMDALSAFFSDKENSNNSKKKPYLKEIFKVAKFEERYKNGEIGKGTMAASRHVTMRGGDVLTHLADGDTMVFVMADDKIPDNYQSDNDENNPAKEDDENDPSSISSSVSPHKTTAPHALIPASTADQSQAGTLQTGQFISDLPVRTAQYTQPMVPPDLSQEQHAYVEGGGMAVGTQGQMQPHASMAMAEICANPHDGSRRPSLFSSPTEYSAPSGPGLYSGNWQAGTTATSNASMYAFTPQHQQHPSQAPFVQPPSVPIAQGQQYLGPPFDGIARSYDPSQAGLFRTGPIHNTVAQPQGYPGYMENRDIPNTALKMEPLGRTRLQ